MMRGCMFIAMIIAPTLWAQFAPPSPDLSAPSHILDLYWRGDQESIRKGLALVKNEIGKKKSGYLYALYARFLLRDAQMRYTSKNLPSLQKKDLLFYSRSAYELAPTLVFAINTLAECYLYLGNYEQAVHFALQSLLYAPNHRDPKAYMILAFGEPGTFKDFLRPQTQRGFLFSQLLTMPIDNPYILEDIAKVYLYNGRPKEALRYLNKAMKFFQEKVSTKILKGIALIQLNKRQQGKAWLKKALLSKGEKRIQKALRTLLISFDLKIDEGGK